MIVTILFPFGEIALATVEANPTPVETIDVFEGSQWQWSAVYKNEGVVVSGRVSCAPRDGGADRRTDPHPPRLERRDARVLRPGLLLHAQRDSRASERASRGRPRLRDLPGSVRRVLRARPLSDAIRREGRGPDRLPRLGEAGAELDPCRSTVRRRPGTTQLTAHNIRGTRTAWPSTRASRPRSRSTNLDDGIDHNFAIYNGLDLQKQLLRRPRSSGRRHQDLLVPADSHPGKYYFQCNVHGPAMSGVFIVKKIGPGEVTEMAVIETAPVTRPEPIGQPPPRVAHDDRPQEDRDPLPGQLARLLRRRGHPRAADAERAGPARPPRFLSPHAYNQVFTEHGTLMIFLFVFPMLAGFGNYFVPLQIGALDMAYPRVNALSFWLLPVGGLTILSGFLVKGGAAAAGWTSFAPLSVQGGERRGPLAAGPRYRRHRVDPGGDQLHRHDPSDARSRHVDVPHPGVLLERHGDLVCCRPGGSRPHRRRHHDASPTGTSGPCSSMPPGAATRCIWQNVFWFFGHPEVYILILAAWGIVSEILPVFSGKPLYGYRGVVLAFLMVVRALVHGVGAPHVRDRRGGAAVLQRHDRADLDPDGGPVLQLARDALERQAPIRTPDAVRAGLHRDVPDRRHRRRVDGLACDGLRDCTTPTGSWRTSTTCCSAARCSASRRACTSGSRR